MEVSEEDFELVNALQMAPRATWTQLGAVLDRHPSTLAARWERLRAAGVAWVTAHPMGDPLQMSLSFLDVQCEPGRRADVAASLCRIPDVVSVEECSRSQDLMLTAITPSLTALGEMIYPQLDAVEGLVRYETFFCTDLHAGGYAWRLNALSPGQRQQLKQFRPAPAGPPGTLPPSFRAIIQVLSRNGRATAAEVAASAGLHPATARRQLQRILASGTLSFRCEIAQSVTGHPVTCQWRGRLPAVDHQEAARILSGFGSMRLCASTTGSSNFLFSMWLRNAADIMRVERAVGEQVPRFELRESVVVTNAPKRVGWVLGRDGTATGEVVPPGEVW
ncbi:Lrp/AsnC family transcriptional regulator [Paenarthrobacter sp. DKR-5]|uniref:Lrp/AsnC family transcriptional regulator n=1 Tax=Paenarthrobacter sp. DKR-5 TaxID=2835535 RepID=UPI001BDCE5AC|nr:Lrp/AsnC family transcriptional regulator [Paenarthrobacter sp. DKR-5]MBT1004080.1 Lrp/AsnC family transcriptional regulator [Paenarthrobacter sp. DKR-5]